MVICGGGLPGDGDEPAVSEDEEGDEVAVEDEDAVAQEDEADEDEIEGDDESDTTLKCLQIDLRRFGLGQYSISLLPLLFTTCLVFDSACPFIFIRQTRSRQPLFTRS